MDDKTKTNIVVDAKLGLAVLVRCMSRENPGKQWLEYHPIEGHRMTKDHGLVFKNKESIFY